MTLLACLLFVVVFLLFFSHRHFFCWFACFLLNFMSYYSKEPSLRATQYLPDIVKLQQFLYDTYHHRIDRKKAKTQTIGDFLKALPSGMYN